MIKAFVISACIVLCTWNESNAQTAEPVQPPAASSSKGAVITQPADQPAPAATDSLGVPVEASKGSTGGTSTAPVDLPPSPGAGKADDRKKPK
jgi:hypothetical protein